MKIVIPMAGIGKRMRPHTLTIPKPLLPIAGKPIVQRLVEEISRVCGEKVTEIGFIIGDFGEEVERNLLNLAEDLGATGRIFYQKEALGTAHAIHCAKDMLDGKTIIGFADTLFKAEFKISDDQESVIWVKKVEDPSAFGVVKLDDNSKIQGFVEKPEEFVSDLAIIGIYYFQKAENLRDEIQYLMDNKVIKGGEYQLTDALINLIAKGTKFECGQVTEWLDCGNKDATVYSNQRILELTSDENLISNNLTAKNSTIIEPCYIGENVSLSDCTIGPHVSIGSNSQLNNCQVENSIIQTNSELNNVNLRNSMIGNHVSIKGENKLNELSVGDYNTINVLED
ncbi:MAG: nucleotidyltransferase [Flavobacteriales bacterium]|nr:nucleotidyltransferase [Flavobacteriales bacterium]